MKNHILGTITNQTVNIKKRSRSKECIFSSMVLGLLRQMIYWSILKSTLFPSKVMHKIFLENDFYKTFILNLKYSRCYKRWKSRPNERLFDSWVSNLLSADTNALRKYTRLRKKNLPWFSTITYQLATTIEFL